MPGEDPTQIQQPDHPAIQAAARHLSGEVILYADSITRSIRNALKETDRRRQKQVPTIPPPDAALPDHTRDNRSDWGTWPDVDR